MMFAVTVVGAIGIIYLYISLFLIKKKKSDPAKTPTHPFFFFFPCLFGIPETLHCKLGFFCSFDLDFASFLYRKWDFRGFLRCFGFGVVWFWVFFGVFFFQKKF